MLNAPRIRALITSHNDRHVWTDRNLFTGMSTEIIKNAVFFVFLSKILIKHTKLLLMTKITLHHLFFSPCVNSSVIVLVLGIFLRELRFLRKIPRPKTITSDFQTMTSKKMVCRNCRFFFKCSGAKF